MTAMTDPQLEALAADLESDRVERKESLSTGVKDKVLQAICAFANDMPGHGEPGLLFIGLRDDGRPSGLTVDDRLLTDLGAIRSDGKILPLPVMTVAKRRLFGQDVAVITVEPSIDPPVRYDGRVWIRVGPRRAIASREEERRLSERRRSRDLPFDERPVGGASLGDLDLDRIRYEYLPKAVAPEILEENGRPLAHQLASLQLASVEGVPTAAALLLFAPNPRRWFPGAYVQFVRFRGLEVDSSPTQQQEIEGPLPAIVSRLDDIVAANVARSLDIGTHLHAHEQADYAVDALQQVLRNALMHRSYDEASPPVRFYWYADRVEIISPGGPYGAVTGSNFGQQGVTAYRNPALATAMKNLRLVQRFGVGLEIARRASERAGCPPPAFDVQPSHVRVTLKSAHQQDQALVLDSRGTLVLPATHRAMPCTRLLAHASAGDDALLRGPDPEPLRAALAEVERVTKEFFAGLGGQAHVFVSAPYPLAAALGAALDRYARDRRVLLHQSVPGTDRWLPLPFGDERVAGIQPYWGRIQRTDLESGSSLVLGVEGPTPLPTELLRALASTVSARRVLQLRALEPAELADTPTLTGAALQLRALVDDLRQERWTGPIHLVTTAPVSLVTELCRLLCRASLSRVIVYVFDPATLTHVPALDIGSTLRIR